MSKTVLTEADKKRIEEEEKHRVVVRKGLEEASKKTARGTGCLVVIIVLIVLCAIGGSLPSSPDKPSPTPVIQHDFKPSVGFTGTQFVITNLADLDCQDAKMVINGGILWGGYVYEGYILKAGKTYEVGALQFTKSDGTRFNPFETKPKDLLITCRGENALNGKTFIGSFN